MPRQGTSKGQWCRMLIVKLISDQRELPPDEPLAHSHTSCGIKVFVRSGIAPLLESSYLHECICTAGCTVPGPLVVESWTRQLICNMMTPHCQPPRCWLHILYCLPCTPVSPYRTLPYSFTSLVV
jgi:hypothetical protein